MQTKKNESSGLMPLASSLKMLMFNCPLNIEAGSDSKSVPKFSMTAYTGGKMNISGFTHPVVVDLDGLEIASQSIPIRLDHKPTQGVGHTDIVLA
ncbi:MAG: hypothetical protein JEZ07_18665 [Phycisphaerae bacterium]|nr:hypothetical protein [Phycisphaerae bacterium]